MGNDHYILDLGIVCDDCNNKFSIFENKVLTQSIYGFTRTQNAVKTKKGKPSYSKTNIKVNGDPKFRKNLISLYDLNEENTEIIDHKTGTFRVTVNDFEGSENAASKFFLKVGIEALFKSRKQLHSEHDFSAAKAFLINENTIDWPFIMTIHKIVREQSIPRMDDKYNLSKLGLKLTYGYFGDELLFRFSYSKIESVVSLTSRNLEWIGNLAKNDPHKSVYPKYLRKKII